MALVQQGGQLGLIGYKDFSHLIGVRAGAVAPGDDVPLVVMGDPFFPCRRYGIVVCLSVFGGMLLPKVGAVGDNEVGTVNLPEEAVEAGRVGAVDIVSHHFFQVLHFG